MTLAVGDIFAIIDKSWALYEILRDSRSSTAQYRDLQNQLRSLYEVLLRVKEVQESGRFEAPPETEPSAPDGPKHGYSLISCITSIVENCADTLDQLYGIFYKYHILGAPADSDRKSFVKLKQFFQKKEKEIKFTTEDLDSLRIQVQLHTNSLGVLLNLVISSQASRIETKTTDIASQTTRIEAQNRKVSEMVEAIYTAWCQNLQVSKGDSTAAPEGSPPDSTDTLFSIFEDANPSSLHALCANARLYPVRDPGEGSASACRLFHCCCDELGGRGFSSHRHAVEAYVCDTFSARLAGDERTWIVYNVGETVINRKVTLRLTNIRPKYMAVFEDSMADLAAQAVPVMLQRGPEGNYFVDISSGSQETGVLAIHSGLSGLVPHVEAVSLSIGGRTFTPEDPVSTLQLLQYDNISRLGASPEQKDLPRLPDKKAGNPAGVIPHDSSGALAQPPAGLVARRPQGYFDINIRYSQGAEGTDNRAGEIAEMNLIVTKDTAVDLHQHGTRSSSVTVQCVRVDVSLWDGQQRTYDQAGVEVHFSSPEAAEMFNRRVEDMRTELTVLDLIQPREEETARLHLSAVRFDCDEFNIPDADFTVLCNRDGRYRLIVASRNRCTIISQELGSTFFKQAKKTGKMNFDSQAHVVQIENTGVRTVTRCNQGLGNLRFERGKGIDGTNMLEIACNTLLIGD